MKNTVRKLNQDDYLFENSFRTNEELDHDLKNNYVYLGYFINDKLVSFISFIILGEELEIHYLVTDNSYQKKGYADILLAYLIKNYQLIMFLEVSIKNTVAINLYKKHGFAIINSRVGYYLNGDDAIILRRWFNGYNYFSNRN